MDYTPNLSDMTVYYKVNRSSVSFSLIVSATTSSSSRSKNPPSRLSRFLFLLFTPDAQAGSPPYDAP